jgi:hypothetical protein
MSFPTVVRRIRMSRGSPVEVVLVGPGDVEVARWPLQEDTPVDLDLVDELASLALAARRSGWTLRVCGAGAELVCLLRLTGLSGTLEAEA